MACLPAHEIGQARRIERFGHHQAMHVRCCSSLRPVTSGCLRVQHATSRSRGQNKRTVASVMAYSSCAHEQPVDGITLDVSAGIFHLWRGTFVALWCPWPRVYLLLQVPQLLLLLPGSFLLFLQLNLHIILACSRLLKLQHRDTSRCFAHL